MGGSSSPFSPAVTTPLFAASSNIATSPTPASSLFGGNSNTGGVFKQQQQQQQQQQQSSMFGNTTMASPTSSNLTASEVELRVRTLYGKFEPTKLDQVPHLMQKYRGNEMKLLALVQKKYEQHQGQGQGQGWEQAAHGTTTGISIGQPGFQQPVNSLFGTSPQQVFPPQQLTIQSSKGLFNQSQSPSVFGQQKQASPIPTGFSGGIASSTLGGGGGSLFTSPPVGNRGLQSSSSGLFNATASPFGQSNVQSTSSPFGQSGGQSLFGQSSTQPSATQLGTTSSSFGQPTGQSVFGQLGSQAATTTFGQSSAFGANFGRPSLFSR
jgi:hypothetical protein